MIQLTLAQFQWVLRQLPNPETWDRKRQGMDVMIAVFPEVTLQIASAILVNPEQPFQPSKSILVRFRINAYDYQYPVWEPTDQIIIKPCAL